MGMLKQRAIEYSYSNTSIVDQKQGDSCSRLPREEYCSEGLKWLKEQEEEDLQYQTEND